jgi:hypothetical protein
MLRTLEGMPDGVLGFEAGDKLTASDFTELGWMRDGLRRFAWGVPGEACVVDLDQQNQAVEWAASST